MLDKMTVRDLSEPQLAGKRALVRVDYNVPLDEDGGIGDDARIRATLPTLAYLGGRGAKIVLLSHLGRPEGKVVPKLSLRSVAERLSELMESEVAFLASATSEDAVEASRRLEAGEVLLIENTRFDPGETANDRDLAKAMAALGDVYVNDAFGTLHRAHASTVGVARLLRPAVAGMLVERELEHLGALMEHPKPPFVAILGGAKVSGKLDLIESLLDRVDRLCVGGAMSCTFFRAMGFEVGMSLVEEELVKGAAALIERAGPALLLPTDVVVAPALEKNAPTAVVARDEIPKDQMVADIGPDTAATFADAILSAQTILWNGPVGVFELDPFTRGTQAIATAVARASDRGATSVAGGGDTAAAVAAFGSAGHLSHISTGGGATLEFLTGVELPGVSVLTDRGSG